METKEYRGNIVRLAYPHFLKIQEGEPKWYALGSKGTTVQVLVDPPQELASIFAESIRSPYFARTPGVFIEREGTFRSARIAGYERLTRLVLPSSGVDTRSWWVEGRFRNRNLLNIEINAVASDWQDGTIWAAFLDSIDVVGVSQEAWFPDEPAIPKPEPVVRSRSYKKQGILVELPKGLEYLLDMAFELGSLPQEDLEDNPEFPEVIEGYLRREMHGLTKGKARSRVKADRERLCGWLKQYPADKYPETASLHVVVGALLYADGVFK